MLARGFTVIEITVVLALIGMLAVLGLFWTRDLFDVGSLEREQHTLVTLFTHARAYAFSNRAGEHGVCYDHEEHAYVSDGIRTSISTRVSVAGLPSCSEGRVVFSALSATTTPVSITLTQEERSVSIFVHREGFIEW